MRYEIKTELGGVEGMVGPLISKQPPNIQIWIVGGEGPAFVKEEGPALSRRAHLDHPTVQRRLA
jgi:hypothetical protein